MAAVTFKPLQRSGFFSEIKEKKDRYFAEKRIDAAGNRKLYIKGAIQVASAIALYTVLVFFTPPVGWAILLCAVFGFNLAVIGFNVMHEGGHQSFSRHAWLNAVAAYSLNVLGGNAHFWKIKHNVNHHTYTNIEGHDADIDVGPLMRLHEHQPRYWFHRFQHCYWIFLYGISYIAWVFYLDFNRYFSKEIVPDMDPKSQMKFREHFIFWLTKVVYVMIYIVIPALMVGWLAALTGFVIAAVVCGITTSVVFQLAHVVEGTSFPLEDETGNINQEWAIHQINTTANFATKSRVYFWLLGGLNFQVEHHLFPRISHIHYPQISRFVKETCQKYGVVYHEHSTLLQALISHLVHLRRLGMR
ncbi:MAG TPA: acyl-CoA desaturase [Cyclobacteriaceae bacterium]|nr:acyl-CoA desaturase [Cyclobacteriaceae bacterium]